MSDGATQCDACEEQYYYYYDSSGSTNDDDDSTNKCHRCPEGVKCTQPDAAERTLEEMDLKMGWWRAADQAPKVYACPVPESCQGGTSTGDDLCMEGYKGPRCAVCMETYFKVGSPTPGIYPPLLTQPPHPPSPPPNPKGKLLGQVLQV